MVTRPRKTPRLQTPDLPTIGWREWVGLPAFGIPAIKAKIDTGARTSALHAFDLETVRRRGRLVVRFSVHPLQRESRTVILVEAEVAEYRAVRSSNGVSEDRPVIVTDIEWQGLKWPVELTLTRRDEMGFRLLLGREAIRNRFLVDSGRSFYAGQPQTAPASSKKKRTKRKKR